MKKALAVVVACAALWLSIPACAGSVYAGSVVATEQESVLAPTGGTLAQIGLTAGGAAEEGAVVAQYATRKVYASADGTVAAVWAEAGEDPDDDAVLEIEPVDKYTVYATTDGAYESEDTRVVHAGETVYIKCTADGTHRGTGTITQITGDEYTVVTTGGAFFVGETVYLYRDADFSYKQKIGIGTLIYSDNAQYSSEGTVIAMHVAQGDRVERGQLLYEVLGADATEILAPVSGIVASVLPGGTDETATATAQSAQTGSAEETSGAAAGAQGSEEVGAGSGETGAGSGEQQSTEAAASSGTEDADSGENAVAEGDVIAVIYPYSGIKVEISVPEADLSDFAPGAQVGVVFADDPETTCMGTVEKIANVAEDGAYTTLISVDRENLFLGMTCDVFAQ